MKIKNQNIKMIVIGCGILLITSCKDILDLEPAQSISNTDALSTEEGVRQALIGAYDYMSVSNIYGGEIMRNSDLYGGEGEIEWVGTFQQPREIFQRNILPANDDVYAFFRDAYATINICNNVLVSLDIIENSTDKKTIEGEAKCIRGVLLFELTRYFGQQYEAAISATSLGVPIILLPTVNPGDNEAVIRNTIEECYAQVIADLSDAETLLPTTNDVFMTKYIAAAFLARVYLQKEDYTNARDAADRVIASGKFSLMENYADCFNQDENTDEDIFAMQVSEQDGSNALNSYYTTAANGGRGDIEIQDAHLDLYAAGDLRKDLFFTSGGSTYTGKFNNEFGNVTVVRLAEMYLIRAECNQRLGTALGANPLDDFNAVHTRAGLTASVSVSLDDILFERRVELAFEGIKIFDIKRLHGAIATMNYDDPKLVFPIPSAEIEVNHLLIQNPGY